MNGIDLSPIRREFEDLPLNTKKSIYAMMLGIAACDSENAKPNYKEIFFLEKLRTQILTGVFEKDSIAYVTQVGKEQVNKNLSVLNDLQKDLLISISFDLMVCDGAVNELEEYATLKIFKDVLGVSEDKYMDVIDRTQNLVKEFTKTPTVKNNQACYIATMIYGDINHPNVELLRQYRDNTLLKNFYGRLFVRTYYRVSPFLVKYIKDIDFIHKFLKKRIDGFIDLLIKRKNNLSQ